MPEIAPPFKTVGELEDALYVLNNATKTIGAIKLATNPTPLGIATLLANVASEQLTDKSIPEHILKYLRKNIKPATGSGNVGPDKSGTVIAEGGYFRDPTQRHATAMRAGQYADGGKVEQDPAFLEALERQRLRDEAFDNEFAIEVAAQSNYAADIDPSIARYYGLPDAAPGYDGLRGFELTPTEEYPEGTFLDKRLKRIFYETKPGALGVSTITPEMGTVSAIDRHANPVTYAHEYRHKNFPELSERQNRIADFLTALDERQLFDMLNTSYKSELDTTLGEREGSEALDFFRYDLRFERDNPGYGVGARIFGDEWDRGARSTRQGMQEDRDDYIRARIEESPAIKLLNQYEELKEYNEDLPEQNQERVEERQEREAEAAVKNYAMGGGVGSMAPVARNMFQGYDIRRGVGAYAPYTRRA
jgi:hypothetical protein